jgi:hypothetical protein
VTLGFLHSGFGHVASAVSRLAALTSGWRWARRAVKTIRAEVRADGLGVVVPAPPTNRRGSLRGARMALRRDSASCLERSLVVQRWWASTGVALDVIVGVRHPHRHDGPLGHAWVEHWDRDFSDQFNEIRRVEAPAGERPRIVNGVPVEPR